MDGTTRTVFVVDGWRDSRLMMSSRLSGAGYQVRSFESAECFLAAQDAWTPGCILLDVALPGMSGLELQRFLRESPLARPMVFLTAKGDIQSGVHAMKSGAVDFLTKPTEEVRLHAAIDLALRRDDVERLQRAARRMIEERFSSLTSRERQVMAGIMRGRLNKQIAAEIGIGEKTVKVHRARVMSKMAVRSVAELVHLAMRLDFVDEIKRLACTPADPDANRLFRQRAYRFTENIREVRLAHAFHMHLS